MYAFPHILEAEEIWIEYGTGKNLQYLPIHLIYSNLPTGVPELIPFLHCFTGCDTVSSFYGIGEKMAWKTWMSYRDVESAFQEFSKMCTTINLDSVAFNVIERFVVLMYHASSSAELVNHARRIMFTQMSRNIEHIPTTSDALLQHVKRAMLQCNIWTNCLMKNPQTYDPCQWGWKKDDSTTFKPLWITRPDVSKHCQELVSCKCKERCTQCRCTKSGLRCTLLCACEGYCSRVFN